jgi:hypothetical protein
LNTQNSLKDKMANFSGHYGGNLRGKISGDVDSVLEASVKGTIRGSFAGTMEARVDGDLTGKVDGYMDGRFKGHMDAEVNGNFQGTIDGTLEYHVKHDPAKWMEEAASKMHKLVQGPAREDNIGKWTRRSFEDKPDEWINGSDGKAK